ncbi:hypothetical protein DH2020_043263 [Rehmannia glutinosa]|uniref:Cysteine proteinase n=1 Tax=Rehmannia glutinosa TaxID=99300 RepID=A0ABR0ULT2_REHGL
MKIHLFLLLVLLGNISDAFEYGEKDLESEEALWSLYERWRSHHTQSRSLEEKMKRFAVFKSNELSIHAFNKLDEPYKLGLNQFSDLTMEEFNNLYTCTSAQHDQADNGTDFTYEDVRSVPDSIDWRKKGAVTLSRINSMPYGCRGGYIESAFDFITKKGITTEKKYPYEGKDGKCKVKKVKSPAVRINGHARVPANDEDALLKAVANQPVSARIDSNSPLFKGYKEESAAKARPRCDNCGLWNNEGGDEILAGKEFMGIGRGEKGYMRMLRDIDDEDGLCGIAMGAAYPLKSSHGESSIKDEL